MFSIYALLVLIVVVVLGCWLISEFVANPKIAKLLYAVIVIFVVLWILGALGVIPQVVSVKG